MHIQTPGPEPEPYAIEPVYADTIEPVAWPPGGRAVITGVPGAGKTLLSAEAEAAMGVECWHTDDHAMRWDWRQLESLACERLHADGPWLLEGHHMVRALRAWLAENPTGAPCDLLVWMPFGPANATPSAQRVGAGAVTVMAQIGDELIRRGVRVVVR